MVQEGKLEEESGERECMSRRKSHHLSGEPDCRALGYETPQCLKMPAESHLIYPKPTWRGTAVNVSICMYGGKKSGGEKKRDQQ